MNDNRQKARFAMGCFWRPQYQFAQLDGVVDTRVGYCGGESENPTYRNIDGHAETVEVTFDPDKISYEEVLNKFWEWHDPTQRNRQGFDIGSQYRSAIYPITDEQERIARESKEKQQEKLDKEIQTKIEPNQEYYEAEEYHQHYLEKNNLVDKKIC